MVIECSFEIQKSLCSQTIFRLTRAGVIKAGVIYALSVICSASIDGFFEMCVCGGGGGGTASISIFIKNVMTFVYLDRCLSKIIPASPRPLLSSTYLRQSRLTCFC